MNSEYDFCFCVCFNLGSRDFRSSIVCFRFLMIQVTKTSDIKYCCISSDFYWI